MRLIIAGSRDITDPDIVDHCISIFGLIPDVVLSGCARGVDKLGEDWARENNVRIERWPAEWNRYGKMAGPRRNGQMADHSNALLLIWDGKSRGSKNMKNQAAIRGLAIFEHIYSGKLRAGVRGS
ncbi:MAG: DUF2493 domain-containing protein [Myxococcota bacterium]